MKSYGSGAGLRLAKTGGQAPGAGYLRSLSFLVTAW
jgi:hypothetical protein